MKLKATVVVVFFQGLSGQAFTQSSNATLSGTIADSTGAVLPGVTVTSTNNATGIVTNIQQ